MQAFVYIPTGGWPLRRGGPGGHALASPRGRSPQPSDLVLGHEVLAQELPVDVLRDALAQVEVLGKARQGKVVGLRDPIEDPAGEVGVAEAGDEGVGPGKGAHAARDKLLAATLEGVDLARG